MRSPISQNLKRFRKKNKLTQQEMAVRLFVTPQAVSKWERGSSLPDITLIPQIAHLFGISISDLWQEEANRSEVLETDSKKLITDQELEEIIREIVRTTNIHEILSSFEFFLLLNKKQKERIIKALLNRPNSEFLVEEFYPYLSPNQKAEVVLELIKRDAFLALESLIPLMNKEMRNNVLVAALEKKAFDFFDELMPFLNVHQKELIVEQVRQKKIPLTEIDNYLTFFTEKQRQDLAIYEED